MKKGIISMLCIALAVGTLTGCGSKKEDNRLVIWTNMNVEVDTLQKYADTWGEQNGYEVGGDPPVPVGATVCTGGEKC